MESKMITIQGCPVSFPVKPYGSQIAMMDRIIKSLNRRENCLVESPTGSGKSLALLCSSLAWQRKEQRRILIEAAENCKVVDAMDEGASCCESPEVSMIKTPEPTTVDNYKTPETSRTKSQRRNTAKPKGIIYIDEDGKDSDLEDFQPSKKVCLKTPDNQKENGSNLTLYQNGFIVSKPSLIQINDKQIFINTPSFISINASGDITSAPILESEPGSNLSSPSCSTSSLGTVLAAKENHAQTPPKQDLKTKNKKKTSETDSPKVNTPKEKMPDAASKNGPKKQEKLPKIYFGTRTHKQVSQIVRELNKTAYNDVSMCILASRDKTCINPIVRNSSNVNEACQELLESPMGAACSFYQKANRINHFNLAQIKNFEAWDIEDLVQIGTSHGACPYFAIRSLMEDAQLIIAPYNYIIDPAIRSAMNINLKNAIIILDEAHNLEDVARDAASLTLTLDEMSRAVKDLELFAQLRAEWRSDALDICKIFSGLSAFIKSNEDNLNEHREFDRGCKVWSGEQLLAILCNVGVGPDNFKKLSKFSDEIQNEKSKNKETEDKNSVKGSKYPSSETLFLIKKLNLNLSFLFMNDNKYLSDYKAAVIKTASRRNEANYSSSWRSKNITGWEFSLNIWCLNPGVAFANINSAIHSLIVTSGTLSPMDSFESELLMKFPLKLEANHVIKKSQVWVGTLSKGPQGKPLKAIFKNMDTFDFQDELGQLVLQVCKTVPDGVLCFVPSYSALDKLVSRWSSTGLLDEIADEYKVVVVEPRGAGSKEKFDTAIKDYYDAIRDGEGGLFLAVCRGKASEGLDFADKNARAVITVGIPFPNFKDIQVDLKKQYNNSKRVQNQALLSGNDWYEIQAFRALNQALGRCIRHRSDWGALIIVDERFQTNSKYATYLSKWVRSSLTHYQSFDNALSSLKLFTDENSLNEGSYAGSYFTQSTAPLSTQPVMTPSVMSTPFLSLSDPFS